MALDNFIPLNAARQCGSCKHHVPMTLTCKAFPVGIPRELICGRWDHRESYPGDNGILYEPRDPNNVQTAPYAKNKIEQTEKKS